MKKTCGVDGILSDVFRNDTSVSILHVLFIMFNVCFPSGVIPSEWGKCIINPISKSNTDHHRDPLSYRGISLAPATYKLYCSVLNERLDKWLTRNDVLVDEQNGVRNLRSVPSQLSYIRTCHFVLLTNIICCSFP